MSTYKRTSCGFCMVSGSHKHRDCPGTLATARAGKPWACWCYENGHPADLPPAPVVEDSAEDLPVEPRGRADEKPATPKPKRERAELAPRCGAQTGKGPCKRKAGHTAGHDAR
jgi:hypothetical protein